MSQPADTTSQSAPARHGDASLRDHDNPGDTPEGLSDTSGSKVQRNAFIVSFFHLQVHTGFDMNYAAMITARWTVALFPELQLEEAETEQFFIKLVEKHKRFAVPTPHARPSLKMLKVDGSKC